MTKETKRWLKRAAVESIGYGALAAVLHMLVALLARPRPTCDQWWSWSWFCLTTRDLPVLERGLVFWSYFAAFYFAGYLLGRAILAVLAWRRR